MYRCFMHIHPHFEFVKIEINYKMATIKFIYLFFYNNAVSLCP